MSLNAMDSVGITPLEVFHRGKVTWFIGEQMRLFAHENREALIGSTPFCHHDPRATIRAAPSTTIRDFRTGKEGQKGADKSVR